MVLYLILLVWILPGRLVDTFFKVSEGNIPPLDLITLLYIVITAVAVAWLQDTYAHTKVGRDIGARVFGLSGIISIAPHIVVAVAITINSLYKICL
jgi:hypothetical protein